LVVSVPGDRRDQDVAESARILAQHFDYFICKADGNRRGRGHDEIPQLMRAGLMAAGVDPAAILIQPEEPEALDHALTMAREGDLVVINGDDTARCWKQIIYFKKPESSKAAPVAARANPVPDGVEALIGDGDLLIRDERGVRLARGNGEAAD